MFNRNLVEARVMPTFTITIDSLTHFTWVPSLVEVRLARSLLDGRTEPCCCCECDEEDDDDSFPFSVDDGVERELADTLLAEL